MLTMPPSRSRSSQRNPNLYEGVLWSTSPSDSAEDGIRQLIRTYAKNRWFSIDEASEALGTSSRTLQRRLGEERTTYSEVLQEIRMDAGKHLLEMTDTRLSEIAKTLGFSNQSNFNRAFIRWAAVSPREFWRQRRKHGLAHEASRHNW
jgi:AraC-like DNA-binding protein